MDGISRNASGTQILALYPHIPIVIVGEVLDLSCKERFRYLGKSKVLEGERKIKDVVIDYIRHTFTDYEALLSGLESKAKKCAGRRLAAIAVGKKVEEITEKWKTGITNNAHDVVTETSQVGSVGGEVEDTASVRAREALLSLKAHSKPSLYILPDHELHYPTLEEAQDSARSKKAHISTWHPMKANETYDPALRFFKRAAPSLKQPNIKSLESALANIELNPIALAQPITTNSASKATRKQKANERRIKKRAKKIKSEIRSSLIGDTRHDSASQQQQQHEGPLQDPMNGIETGIDWHVAQPQGQIASLLAGKASLGLQDTIQSLSNDDSLYTYSNSGHEVPIDAASENQKLHPPAVSKPDVRKVSKGQAQRERRKRVPKGLKAAEARLQALLRNPGTDSKKIAKASKRVDILQRRLERRALKRRQRHVEETVEITDNRDGMDILDSIDTGNS